MKKYTLSEYQLLYLAKELKNNVQLFLTIYQRESKGETDLLLASSAMSSAVVIQHLMQEYLRAELYHNDPHKEEVYDNLFNCVAMFEKDFRLLSETEDILKREETINVWFSLYRLCKEFMEEWRGTAFSGFIPALELFFQVN